MTGQLFNYFKQPSQTSSHHYEPRSWRLPKAVRLKETSLGHPPLAFSGSDNQQCCFGETKSHRSFLLRNRGVRYYVVRFSQPITRPPVLFFSRNFILLDFASTLKLQGTASFVAGMPSRRNLGPIISWKPWDITRTTDCHWWHMSSWKKAIHALDRVAFDGTATWMDWLTEWLIL